MKKANKNGFVANGF